MEGTVFYYFLNKFLSVFSDSVCLLDAIQAGLRTIPEDLNSRLSIQRQLTEQMMAQNEEEREPPPREPQPPSLHSPTHQDHLVAQLKDEIQVQS